MKHLLVLGTLALAIHSQAQARSFVCKSTYTKKISESEFKSDRAGKTGLIAGAIGLAGVMELNPFIAFGGGAVLIGGLGTAGYYGFTSYRYSSASILIQEALKSRKEVIDGYEAAYMAIERESAAISLTQVVNPKRAEIGLAPLSLDEYIKNNPLKPFPRHRIKETNFDEFAKDIQKHFFPIRKISQADVQNLLVDLASSDDTLCKNGRPLKYSELKNLILERL